MRYVALIVVVLVVPLPLIVYVLNFLLNHSTFIGCMTSSIRFTHIAFEFGSRGNCLKLELLRKISDLLRKIFNLPS